MSERVHTLTTNHTRQLALAAGGLAALAGLALGDPHRPGLLSPRCPTKLLTGLDCPACGGLRMSHDLLHGNVRAAMQDNPFLLLCSPAVALVGWRSWRARGEGRHFELSARTAYAVAAVAAVWTIIRNLPRWPLKPR